MSSSVSYAAAFGAGVISFASPCVLPLVPVYLGLVTGVDITDAGDTRASMRRVVLRTSAFVAGFTVVFVLLGASATVLGAALADHQSLLTRLSGVVVLAMGVLLLLGAYGRWPAFAGTRQWRPDLSRYGDWAAPVAGAAFAFGWTPCLGPILGALLAMASTSQEVGRGATLLATYGIGLGVAFLVAGLAFSRLTRVFGWLRRHAHGLTVTTAAILLVFGVLLVLDRLVWVIQQLQNGLAAIGLERLLYLG